MDKMIIFAAVFKSQCYETTEHNCHHFAEHPVLRCSAIVLLKERIPSAIFGQYGQRVPVRIAVAGNVVC